MQWQKIEPAALMRDYGSWITPRFLSNNRVIGLLGLAEQPYQLLPDATAWVLHDSHGRVLQILVQAAKEISLVNHPQLQLDTEQVAAIFRKFPGSWVLTCHEEQCELWEAAARSLGVKDVPVLSTFLYQVKAQQLRTKALPEALRFEALPRFTAQIGRYMQGFMQDALQHRVDEYELRSRFARQEFFGLWQGEQLLSIAAITRRHFHARCLSYVYTPNRLRGQDYAGLTVEHLCRHIFQDPAMQLVFLYADQTNPYSNRLYQKLGFELVCSSRTY